MDTWIYGLLIKGGLRVKGLRLWIMGYGLWVMDLVLLIMGHKLWVVGTLNKP